MGDFDVRKQDRKVKQRSDVTKEPRDEFRRPLGANLESYENPTQKKKNTKAMEKIFFSKK